MSQTLKKWKPILDNILSPYELENEILEMLADFLEIKLESSSSISLGANGIPSISQSAQQLQVETFNIILEFKERLAKDVDIRIDIKNVYYNTTIKRIVYELANGDSVYMESKPLVMKDSNYIEKSKKLFLSISDSKNPKLRRYKIEDIKNNI
jgi:hypothetical protein